LISFYNSLLFFLRIAFSGFKYAIGATGFTMILLAATYIDAVFNQVFAVAFAASMHFCFNIIKNPLG